MSAMKKIIIAAAVILIAAVIINKSNGAVPAAELRLDRVKKDNLREFIKLRGKIEYENKATIYSQLAGVIDFDVKEGDVVKKGVKIASIDSTALNIALEGAVAARNAAAANLAEVGSGAKAEELSQAAERCGQAKIAFNSALTDFNYKKDLYNKMTQLKKSGSVSEQNQKDIKNQYDAAQNFYLESERMVKIAEYNLAILKRGASENVIAASRYALEQAEAVVAEVKDKLRRAEIISAMDGILLSKYYEPGSYVMPGVLLFETGDTGSAYIRADVLTDEISKVKPGGAAVIGGDILDGGSFEARICYIAPKAFTKVSSLGVEQQKIEVRLNYDKTNNIFRPGYEFDVDIVANEKTGAKYVPYKAVFDLDGRDSVFVVKDGRLILREVKTGIENDDFIEIISGLDENETVVTDPPSKLKPGMKIL
jgi:HlyD family secretion protein